MLELGPDNALAYLRSIGQLGSEPARVEPLGWGVSNVVLRVETPDRRFVLKQSRPQLRTRDAWFSDLDRIYTTIKDRAGHIDVLAVNAGYYEFGKFGEITEEHFDRTFNTNVRGLLFTVQKALPLLTEAASVILTGSIASIKGFPSLSVYNASKAAVRSFARSWIADLKGCR